MRIRALLPCLALVACASPTPPDAVEAPQPREQLSVAPATQSLVVDHEAFLTFRADGQIIEENQPIYAGGRLTIRFAENRLPRCRATYNGMPTWGLSAWMMSDVSQAQSFPLRAYGQYYTATMNIPEDATEIDLWFKNTDRAGCVDYDSNDGENYTFDVSMPIQPTRIRFDEDWSEAADGPLVQGGLLQIDYAPARLRSCRATYAGGRAWNIMASWRFLPSGEMGQVGLYQGDYYAGESAITQPTITLPDDATGIELWFSNSDRAGCVDWDSNFNENYAFDIVPPDSDAPEVGWVGDWDFVQFHRDSTHRGDVDPAWYYTSMDGSETVTYMEVQVWIPSITDVDYPSADAARAAAAERVVAEAITDAAGEPWPLEFERKQGNNFVYSFRFWKTAYEIYNETPAEAGLYTYHARFSTDGGETYYETDARRFVISQELDCSLFPDNAPSECAQTREVGWAGDWAVLTSRICQRQTDVPDPVHFFKSGLGHDCMAITADVWVPGLTDANGQPSDLIAEVETNLGFNGGPSVNPLRFPLRYVERVDNNYRYEWQLSEHVGRADTGLYRYRFHFSADQGRTWYTLGGDDGDWRTLRIYNDSTELGGEEICEDHYVWSSPYNQSNVCVDYEPIANEDANGCELYVNGFGRGNLSHHVAHATWLEAYIAAPPADGRLLNVGMFLQLDNGEVRYQLGELIEPDYYMTGITLDANLPPEGAVPPEAGVEHLAFFADIRQADGTVTRFWQSAQGQNYTLEALYDTQGFVLSRGIGSVEYVDEADGLFHQRNVCR